MSEIIYDAKSVNTINELKRMVNNKYGYGCHGTKEFTRKEWEKHAKLYGKNISLYNMDALRKRGLVKIARVEEFTKVITVDDSFNKNTNLRTKITQEIKMKRYFYEMNVETCMQILNKFKNLSRWANMTASTLTAEAEAKLEKAHTLNHALGQIENLISSMEAF